MESSPTVTDADAFQTVRSYATDIGLTITETDEAEMLLIVEDEERGIARMVIDCEYPVLEIQQSIMAVPAGADTTRLFERLLQMNGTLVHGAFMLSEDGQQIRFRDTLRLSTLDLAELRGTVNALHLALEEHGDELVALRRRLDGRGDGGRQTADGR